MARLNFYVPASLKDNIVKKSSEMGLSMTSYIVVALNEYMKQSETVDFFDILKQMKNDGKI